MYELLKGMRIVEGSAFVAAPLGGMTLAQLGADVIRFDDVRGALDGDRWPVTADGVSIYWAGLNKGKRSIAVDVRSPEGQEILVRLITAPGPDAGLFSTNLPLRGWSSWESLSARRPDLIMVTLTGKRDGAAQVDYTVNAAMGFPMVTGPVGHDGPVNNVLPAWDLAAGLTISTGLLAAERWRRTTGQGQLIKLSLFDVGLAATAALGYFGEAEINRADRERLGNHIFGTFGESFRTKEGRWVMVCMFTERHVRALKKLMGGYGVFERIEAEHGVRLEIEGDRYAAREPVAAVIRDWVGARSLGEVATAFDEAGLLWGPYRTFRELLEEDPSAVREHPMFAQIEQPGIGACFAPGSPLDFTALRRLPPKPAPRLGQHTDEILADVLGMASGEIGRLHDSGVVAGPK